MSKGFRYLQPEMPMQGTNIGASNRVVVINRMQNLKQILVVKPKIKRTDTLHNAGLRSSTCLSILGILILTTPYILYLFAPKVKSRGETASQTQHEKPAATFLP